MDMDNMPRVAAVILTRDQKDLTLNCLRSLSACSYPELRIIVVDNHSSDRTAEAIRSEFPDVLLVEHTTNAGVAGGRNLGLQAAEKQLDYSYLLILDNDTTVDKDFLQPMVNVMESDPDIGVVAPKIYLQGEENILDQAGGSIVNLYTGSTAKRGFGEPDHGQYDHRQRQDCLPSGACSLSRRSVIVECGGLDEVFNPYGFEDLDYSLRVKKAGYKLAYVPESVIYHLGNKTGFQGYSQSYAALKGRHLKLFMKRHASPFQRACFHLLLPLLGMRTLAREIRRGNVKAVLRLVQAYLRG
jgi:GT2 family glycosyltransferase